MSDNYYFEILLNIFYFKLKDIRVKKMKKNRYLRKFQVKYGWLNLTPILEKMNEIICIFN